MNTARIQSAAANIAKCEAALKWLDEYGAQLSGRGDGASVTVSLNFASSCNGAKEAQEVMSSYARLSLPDFVKTAIENCRNTIAMEKDAIREELGRAALTGDRHDER